MSQISGTATVNEGIFRKTDDRIFAAKILMFQSKNASLKRWK